MDWLKPDNNSNYQTEVLTEIKTRDENNAKQDYGSDTNLPVGTIRFNRTTKKWEEWGGVSWAVPVADYAIDVASVAGVVPGNATGNIALSNGALCTNLNADLLDGNQGSFYQNAANLNTGSIPLARIPTTLTGKDADLLDGQHGSYYRSCTNLTGILPAARFNDASHGNRAGGSSHAAATTAVNGFMTAADKEKLDGIADGATAEQSASSLLTLIKTVDGPSSGLNADQLDGLDSTAFMIAGGANQVGRTQLKTAEQTFTLASNIHGPYTLTGGQWCFEVVVKSMDVSYVSAASYVAPGYYSGSATVGSYNSAGNFVGKSENDMLYYSESDPGASVVLNTVRKYLRNYPFYASLPVTFGSTYITASKPYNIGDGDIPLFVFAEIDNGTGEVNSVTIAEDPPWAYNGPTNTRPDYYLNGKGYQRKRVLPVSRAQALGSPALMEQYLDSVRNPVFREMEVSQAVKNADMNIVPHSWAGNDLFGKTIVMLDPVSKMTEDLLALHLSGEDVGSLIVGNKLIIDNTGINRKSPDAVMPVAYRWKLSHNK